MILILGCRCLQMYDIFFVSKAKINEQSWKDFHELYPSSIKIEYVKNIDDIRNRAFTKMFWIVWDDLVVDKSFDLRSYQATKWDDMYVHIFKNGDFFDGICLFPKKLKISQREFDHRFFTEKKEVDIHASLPKSYDIFYINTYDDYLDAIEASSTEMFWSVWKEIEITDNKIFNLYFSHHNIYDRNENHVFKHLFRKEEIYANGLVLFSKNKKISKKELDHRFLITKKEHDVLVSKMKPYDIVFISYNEPNADENYDRLLKNFPRALRVDKVKGIHQAHIKAAQSISSEMFWVVDGDAVIVDNFQFDYETSTYERDIVHVWKSQNPINDLVYGYGGVKLLPRQLTLEMDVTSADMTTAISKKFKAIPEISNITAFNTDPFNTWKSAFRECVKLSSKVIDRQRDSETDSRLETWCTSGKDKPFGKFAIDGAFAGTEYGKSNQGNIEALRLINNFDWLKEQYEQRTKNINS